jgi:HAMP domain-containing protein
MLKNLNLSTKLNLLLLSIFLVIVITSGWALSIILGGTAEQEIASKAFLLIETMSSVREYTATQITPELNPRLAKETRFLAQTVPAYSAREVFENLHKRERYSDYFYKEATLNPTNPRDQADKFETTLVNQFRQQSGLKELKGFRSFASGDFFYVARPLTVPEQSCLRCHSTPAAAPKSQIATYGSDGGFGWKLNEIIGAQVISVPASKVINEARRLQFLVIGSLIGFFLMAILIINLFLRFAVTRPLKQMAQLSKQVSTGNMAGEFEHPANDEIGVLAASLNRMKVSLEMAMNMLNSETQE